MSCSVLLARVHCSWISLWHRQLAASNRRNIALLEVLAHYGGCLGLCMGILRGAKTFNMKGMEN